MGRKPEVKVVSSRTETAYKARQAGKGGRSGANRTEPPAPPRLPLPAVERRGRRPGGSQVAATSAVPRGGSFVKRSDDNRAIITRGESEIYRLNNPNATEGLRRAVEVFAKMQSWDDVELNLI